jgi:hypothetical protein
MININPIPYGILMLILFVAGGFWLYNKAATDCRNEYQAKQAESLTRAIAQANEQAAIDAGILRAASERQATHEIRTQILTKTVTRHVASTPVFTSCSVSECGLCLALAAANATDSSTCPCGLDASMPAPGSAAERDNGGTAGELHRDGEPPAQLPGYARRAGGLGQGNGDQRGDE